MGQCCGFVKSDKAATLTTSQREERYKEIEQAIQKIDDMDKKNELLNKLNGRPSIAQSKESYDAMAIQHKIYQGPQKDQPPNSNLNVVSKEDVGSVLSAKKSDLQNDSLQKEGSQIKSGGEGGETQGQSPGDVKGSQQNAVDGQQSNLNVVIESGKEQSDIKNGGSMNNLDKNNSNLKVVSQNSKQMDQQTKDNNNTQGQQPEKSPGKTESDHKAQEKPTSNGGGLAKKKDNDAKTKDKEKCVGFDLEDIEREMKKSGRFNKMEGAQTDYDNQSTTKTEKQVKGVLKKYSDVASCYTGDGDTRSVKKKGKKVKFKDPQKPKKKASKRQYH